MKSNSVKMKICINCSSPMSEDSEFCANCGQKFEEKTNLTGGLNGSIIHQTAIRKKGHEPGYIGHVILSI